MLLLQNKSTFSLLYLFMSLAKHIIPFLLLFVFSTSFSISKSELLEKHTSKASTAYKVGNYSGMIAPIHSSFELDTILANDICFFYGALMYHYSHKKQSEASLLRYLKLTRKEGEFYEDALELLRLMHPYDEAKDYLPKELIERKEGDIEIAEEVDIPLGVEEGIPCEEGSEFAICPVCFGEGVKVSTGSFGKIYRTCPKCHGKGVVKCDNNGKHEHE